MQLLNIEILNFRQYKSVNLELAHGNDNKLTVILGENGYGKTTLIRSFVWCLYGENTFKDKILLNKDVADSMCEGITKKVKVRIDLKHNNCRYRITRYEEYKFHNGKIIKLPISSLNVQRDGETIVSDRAQIEINKILKEDLKDYFFYDGEHNRIEASVDRRSIRDTISQMMGIKRIESLRDYFKASGTYTIPNNLTNKLQGDALELNPLLIKRDKLNIKRNEYESDVNKCKIEISRLSQQLSEKESLISANENVRAQQIKKKELTGSIKNTQARIDDDFSNMISTIQPKSTSHNKNALPFLKILFAQCFKLNNISNIAGNSSFGTGKSLSHISEEAVNQLVERGVCLCGTKIENGNDAYNHLQEAKEHMEPHDFGKYLSDFIEAEENNVNYSIEYVEHSKEKISMLLDNIEQVENDKDNLENIKKEIMGRPDVGQLQQDASEISQQINQMEGQKNYILDTDIPDVERELNDILEKIGKCASKTKENELLKLCLGYAEAIYEVANKKIYDVQTKTRELIEKEVNEVFKKVYHGEKTIQINDNFEIITNTNSGILDNSTGTETVKNFSFVAGLLTSVKNSIIDNLHCSEDCDEIFPLVMDAPFSDVDGSHIKKLCEVLPEYCDQIIMGLIRKDYDAAKDVLSSKIGKLYHIEKYIDPSTGKESETHSIIKEGE